MDYLAPRVESITVQELGIGVLHKDQTLSGRIYDSKPFRDGIRFTIEDIFGDRVPVCISNISSLFQEGSAVKILEPYYKSAPDGSAMICIDDRAAIVDISDSFPTQTSEWKAEGDAAFLSSRSGAVLTSVRCWSRAIDCEMPSVSVLLSNRAAAHLSLGKSACAARDAWAASQLDKTNSKAMFRLATAMNQLGMPRIAHGVAKMGKQLCPASNEFQKLLEGVTRKVKPLGPLWWENNMLIAAIEDSIGDKVEAPAIKDWEALKADGNERFRSGDFAGAIDQYTAAILICGQTLIKLLCTRSTGLLKLGKFEESTSDATVALVTDPRNAKAWYRRALALEQQHRIDKGYSSCVCGLQVGGTAEVFEPLQSRLAAKRGSTQKPEPTKDVLTTKEQKELLDRHTLPQPEYVDTSAVQAMNTMVDFIMMDKKRQIQLFGGTIKPVADYRYDVLNTEGRWPEGVDPKFAAFYLNDSYQHTRYLPYVMQMGIEMESFKPEIEDILKRIGTPDRFAWWGEAQVGEVCNLESRTDYCSWISHSFSNQAYRSEVLQRGTTHVAVGFVDLGALLVCEIKNAPKGKSGPVLFSGFERSAYAVSKSLVIWEMLKNSLGEKDDQCIAVLQIWFSATWSPNTVSLFRKAIASLRKKKGEDSEVMAILDHWGRCPEVPLLKARKEWAELHSARSSNVGHLLDLRERVAYIKYELTGDLGIKQFEGASGSITMFGSPDGTPPIIKDETALSTIKFVEFVSEKKKDQTIMDLLESFLLSKIRRLMGWAQDGTVEVELHHKSVEHSVDLISSLHPWTMSWSNLIDYMSPDSFHRIARACSSKGDTIHFGYSMNWSFSVKGTHIMDYGDSKMRENIIKLSNQAVSTMYKMMKVDSLVRLPPPCNPFNTTTFALQKGFTRKWIEWWVNTATRTGPCRILTTEPALDNPLSPTGPSSLYFTWTYDPEVTANPFCVNV